MTAEIETITVDDDEGSSGFVDELFSADDDHGDVYIDLDSFWKVMGGPASPSEVSFHGVCGLLANFNFAVKCFLLNELGVYNGDHLLVSLAEWIDASKQFTIWSSDFMQVYSILADLIQLISCIS